MRRRFFVLLEGREPEILEKLVKALFEWLASLWYEMVEYLLDQLMELFTVDLSYFAERVPVIDDIANIFVAVGWALLLSLIHILPKSTAIREEHLTMKPTMEILENVKQNSARNKDEVFTRLYRYMLRPDLYYQANQNLYANNGASTQGVNGDTADGFSQAKIERIIQMLSGETYTVSYTHLV